MSAERVIRQTGKGPRPSGLKASESFVFRELAERVIIVGVIVLVLRPNLKWTRLGRVSSSLICTLIFFF